MTARRSSTNLQTRSGAHPAGRPAGEVQAVVDQQAVGDRFPRRVHELHRVEVGEEAVEAGGIPRPLAWIATSTRRARWVTKSCNLTA